MHELREFYALADRAVVALESIAWSLTMIEKHLTPQVQTQEHPLDAIPGLDDLVNASPPESQTDRDIVSLVESEQVDAASIAREAEALFNAAATPDVGSTVEIGEGETAKPVLNKINLFHQDRHDIADLVECYPNDPIIQEYIRKRDLPTQPVYATNVLAAAIGLVYKHLPADLYGTVQATAAINQFIQQHSEDV